MTENEQIQEMARVIEEPCVDSCKECEYYAHQFDIPCMDLRRAKIIYTKGYRKIPDNIGEFSDGFHTFNELYYHRAVLFSVICNMFPEKSWKSKLHDTGDMFDGMFIVGIETEQGQATYHYDIDPYWDMFKVKELEKAPKWDGHTSNDAIQRIGDISTQSYRKVERGEWVYHPEREEWWCSLCGDAVYTNSPEEHPSGIKIHFCPNCGADMRGGRKDAEIH